MKYDWNELNRILMTELMIQTDTNKWNVCWTEIDSLFKMVQNNNKLDEELFENILLNDVINIKNIIVSFLCKKMQFF